MPRRLLTLLLALTAGLVCVPAAGADVAQRPWPPAGGSGQLFVHFGEEHWNDDDGLTLLPKVVSESVRYRPRLVTMSGDKDNDGTVEQLTRWRQIMEPFDVAGIPYYAGTGNHDRKTPPGIAPGTAGLIVPGVQGSLANYASVFAGRPYPFGDAAPPPDPLISPRSRPASDPPGASSHYFVDYDKIRWIFLDNSCWGITDCDASQRPSFPDAQGNRTQLEFLERNAADARDRGMAAFVVMHMPTRDPRDQEYIDPQTFNHVMGKGLSPTGAPDNERFERIAERTAIDGVFLGHIKGQFLYEGRGGVPYFIDGGAGGELYTEGPVGTDHGYWHGFRLIRVENGELTTDAVPIFVEDGIRIEGAELVKPREISRYEAFGRQPVFNDPAKVERLELRDPDPVRPASSASQSAFIEDGGWIFAPVLLLTLGGLFVNGTIPLPRRRSVAVAMAGAATAAVCLGGVSLAQQSETTTTPLASLPAPARIFTTSNQFVIAPVAAADDDPRRNRATQTENGIFRARCPGAARVRVTSGWETSAKPVTVPSRRGKIMRRARVLVPRRLTPGRSRTVARIRLVQRAEVRVRVLRKGEIVRVLRHSCATARKPITVRWNGRVARKGRLRPVAPGHYRMQVVVRSDRKPIRRSRAFRVVRRG